MNREMERRAIKRILTEENYEKVKEEEGISLEYALHLYHELDRDQQKINERIESFFKDNKEKIETIKENIEAYRKMIDTTLDVKKGLFQDHIKGQP